MKSGDYAQDRVVGAMATAKATLGGNMCTGQKGAPMRSRENPGQGARTHERRSSTLLLRLASRKERVPSYSLCAQSVTGNVRIGMIRCVRRRATRSEAKK